MKHWAFDLCGVTSLLTKSNWWLNHSGSCCIRWWFDSQLLVVCMTVDSGLICVGLVNISNYKDHGLYWQFTLTQIYCHYENNNHVYLGKWYYWFGLGEIKLLTMKVSALYITCKVIFFSYFFGKKTCTLYAVKYNNLR